MNCGKQKEILGRIREALKVSAPIPHIARRQNASQLVQPKAWLPAVPPDQAGQLALFQKNCLQLKTEFCLVRGTEEAGRVAKELREKYGWSLAASHHQIQLDAVVRTLGIETVYMEDQPAQTALEKCSVGITACDAAYCADGLHFAHRAKRRWKSALSAAAASSGRCTNQSARRGSARCDRPFFRQV